jgi:hypothetical protein
MPHTEKPAPGAKARASGVVVGGRRDSRNFSQHPDETQAGTDRELYDGRRHLGTVRETATGDFVAVVDEHIVGSFNTITEATNMVLELARGAS